MSVRFWKERSQSGVRKRNNQKIDSGEVMSRKMRYASCGASIVLAALIYLPAGAQAVAAPEPSGSGDPAAVQADTSAVGLSETVVTAPRREERLPDVPVAVTALQADTIAQHSPPRTDQKASSAGTAWPDRYDLG